MEKMNTKDSMKTFTSEEKSVKCRTNEIFDECPKFALPKNLFLGKSSQMIQASINQSFLNAPKRDHQFLSLLMCFVAYGSITSNPGNVWKSSSINNILLKGHEEFLKIRRDPKFDRSQANYLKSTILDDKKITFNSTDKKLIGRLKTSNDNIFNVFSGLEGVLSHYSACFFICANTTMLIGKDDAKSFFVFDPHGRTQKFRRNFNNGMAALMTFESIANIVHLILKLSSFRHDEVFLLVAVQIESVIQSPVTSFNYKACDLDCQYVDSVRRAKLWSRGQTMFPRVNKFQNDSDSEDSTPYQSCTSSVESLISMEKCISSLSEPQEEESDLLLMNCEFETEGARKIHQELKEFVSTMENFNLRSEDFGNDLSGGDCLKMKNAGFYPLKSVDTFYEDGDTVRNSAFCEEFSCSSIKENFENSQRNRSKSPMALQRSFGENVLTKKLFPTFFRNEDSNLGSKCNLSENARDKWKI